MTFTYPWAIAVALPIGLLMWWVARIGVRAVPKAQHRRAVFVRICGVLALSLALSQPVLVRSVDDRTVLFLLDRSDSIGTQARDEQIASLLEALEAARPDDKSAIAVFGRELKVDSSLATGRTQVQILAEIDSTATDLGGALRAAGALLPSEGSRRIVVFTDLVETTPISREVARELADLGIAVDIIASTEARSADVLVESVRLPPVVREGDRVPVEITLRSNHAGPAMVSVTAEGQTLDLDVNLRSGVNTVGVELEALGSGPFPVEVEVKAAFDTKPGNNVGTGITRVLGPARVAVVEGKQGEADLLVEALEAGGILVEKRYSVPTPDDLLGFDGVILVNVDEPDASEAESLRAFVEDLGRGLVTVGGDRSYGLGDYHKTLLEAILPVDSNPDDMVRRQPVAQVLVIDTSGSMAACHCSDSQHTSGVNKTDISRAGAELAIAALSDNDQIGVLAFSSGYEWVIPLGPKPSDEAAKEALRRLFPMGDTEINPALNEALSRLLEVDGALRHIVLFTDGWDPNESNLLPTARSIADAGVTLSVLGTGEGAGMTLRRMADIGGGRFYPGADIYSVPEIFVEETLTVARNLATEGTFFPALGPASPITADLTSSPPLFGYVLTKAKQSASVPMLLGAGDPLLATWQRGLGRVTSWTSDATNRWPTGWVTWEGYVEFWGDVVRDVLPAGRVTPPEVWVDGGTLNVRLENPGLGEGAAAVARIRHPDGRIEAVSLRRSGAGEFSGSVPASTSGAYWVSVELHDGEGGTLVVSSGAVSSYEQELAFREADPALGPDLAEITGGRYDPDPKTLFEPTTTRGRAETSIWPWLVALGLALFLLDVAMRRLVIGEGDKEEWKTAMVTETAREKRRVEEVIQRRKEEPEKPIEVVSDSETLQRLMRRKQR